jgi:hypothetical protein
VERENLLLFSKPETVQEAVDPGDMQLIHEFYADAQADGCPAITCCSAIRSARCSSKTHSTSSISPANNLEGVECSSPRRPAGSRLKRKKLSRS